MSKITMPGQRPNAAPIYQPKKPPKVVGVAGPTRVAVAARGPSMDQYPVKTAIKNAMGKAMKR